MGKIMATVEVNVAECEAFAENPFGVRDDVDMEMLVQSIKEYGLIVPIVVRPKESGGYEIISGHRRVHACKKAGIERIPAFVRQMDRDEAVIFLVDSNLQRESLLPSEKAAAYKMKLEAIKHQGKTSRQPVGKLESADLISETESGRTVQRYIRLTKLEKPLLDLVDEGRIALTPAVELSYLAPEEQRAIVKTFETDEITPSYAQAVQMRKMSETGHLTPDRVFDIMTEIKGNQKEYLKLPMDRYERFLGRFRSPKDMEEFVFKALDFYTRYLARQRSNDAR